MPFNCKCAHNNKIEKAIFAAVGELMLELRWNALHRFYFKVRSMKSLRKNIGNKAFSSSNVPTAAIK